jgi:hypothetical protein
MVVILILRNQLEALKVSKVYKVFKDLKVILVSADRRVSKVFKVYKDLKVRLDREVKRGPHLPMMILHLNSLSY